MKLTMNPVVSLALVALAAPAVAQDELTPPAPKPDIDDLLPGGPGAGQADPQKEMAELFQEVERRLHDMGGYLLDAGAGDTSALAGMDASGIEELLKLGRPSQPQPTGGIADLLAVSRGEGQKVIEGIDRILQLAQQNGGT